MMLTRMSIEKKIEMVSFFTIFYSVFLVKLLEQMGTFETNASIVKINIAYVNPFLFQRLVIDTMEDLRVLRLES